MATSPTPASRSTADTDDSHDSADAPGSADDDLPYEAARAQLQEVLRALESGGQPLEESLALWRRGEDLADICQRWLDSASARLAEAIAARDEEPTP